MRMKALLVASLVLSILGVAAPAFADQRSDAKDQVDFGITVAQKGLWKEAVLRWEKAVEIDPTYAAAWNNLGIGYEQLGRFDDARKAYEKALELEPNNTFIRNNYDQFREIYDRQNRRRGIASLGLVARRRPAASASTRSRSRSPIQAKIDVSPFQRVLVAGFLAGGSKRDRSEHRDGAPAAQPAAHQVRT